MAATGLLRPPQSPGASHALGESDLAEMASPEVVVDLDVTRVDFMDVSPEHLVCPSCRKVFRNPHVASCCSTVYCRKCIDGDCPSCATPCELSFSEATQRAINELYIRCTHVQDGCMWFGKLGYLPIHLDEAGTRSSEAGGPSRKFSVSSCAFVRIACPHDCGVKLNRLSLLEHTTKRCKERPYTCEHCGDFSSTFAETERDHFPSCSMFPLKCPNKCPQKSIPRWRYEQHLASECPYQDNVACTFSFAGCQAKMRRKEIETHLKNNLVQHLAMLSDEFLHHKSDMAVKLETAASQPAANGTKGVEDGYNETLTAKDGEIQRLKNELQQAKREKDEEMSLMREMLDTLKQSMEDQERRLRVAETLNSSLIKEVGHLRPFMSGPLPITFTVTKFDQLRKADKWWYSRPFYSGVCSYRLSMFLFCNGVLDGKGTHLSLFIYLVRGEYDDELVWPFRANVSVHLLNQRGDRNHYQKMIRFTPDTPPAVCSRVTSGEMAKEGNGPTQFISFDDLALNSSTDTQYLRDDCLKIRVNSVHLKSMNKGRSVSIDGIGPRSALPPSSPVSTIASTPPVSPTTPAIPEQRSTDDMYFTEQERRKSNSPTTPKKNSSPSSSPGTPKKNASPSSLKKDSSPGTPKNNGTPNSTPGTPVKNKPSDTVKFNGSPSSPKARPLTNGDMPDTELQTDSQQPENQDSSPAVTKSSTNQEEAISQQRPISPTSLSVSLAHDIEDSPRTPVKQTSVTVEL